MEVFASDVDITIANTVADQQTSFPLVLPSEDILVTIFTSDTLGQYIIFTVTGTPVTCEY